MSAIYPSEKAPRSALAESEARLRQVTENIQEVLTLQDAQTREMLYVSPAYETIFGRSVESLYADPASFLNAVRPDDREMLLAAMKNQGEDKLDVQYRIVHPSGEERWIHARTFPIRNEKDEVYRLTGIIEDITDFKRLTLAEHEQRVFAEALRHAANALTSTLDMNEVLDRILSSIERVVPHNAADIMLINEGVARVVGSRGYTEQNLEPILLAEQLRRGRNRSSVVYVRTAASRSLSRMCTAIWSKDSSNPARRGSGIRMSECRSA